MKKKIILFLSLLCLISAIGFKTMCSTITLSQSIFHLKVPIKGSNIQVFYAFFLRTIPVTIIIFLIIYLLSKIKFKKINLNIIFKYSYLISIIFLIISLFILLDHLNTGTYIINQFSKTSIYDDYYVDSKSVDIKFPDKKRNLIYIFVESLENTYLSKELGGNMDDNLIYDLSILANQNINFSNNNLIGGAYQVNNTEWTAASLIGQTSGLPLNLSLTVPNYSDEDYFFPEIKTLGDILKDNGYKNVFMLGSDANFGGRKSYFINHGDYEILDLNKMKENELLDKDYHVWWGYEDSKLFSFAKDELNKLSKIDQPFNLTLLTSDTHFVDGYLESNCPKKYKNNISNVVSCSSSMINEFISWIKKQDFYNNTTIIITGDHLYMDSYYLNSNDYTRTIFNTFINSAISTTNNKNRMFSILDMYPSTLASLGVKINGDRLGLGTNLFSEQKTIIEEIGLDLFNKELAKDSTYYNYLLGQTKKD